MSWSISIVPGSKPAANAVDCTIRQPVERPDDDMRDFVAEDLNGNRSVFGSLKNQGYLLRCDYGIKR